MSLVRRVAAWCRDLSERELGAFAQRPPRPATTSWGVAPERVDGGLEMIRLAFLLPPRLVERFAAAIPRR